MQHNRTFYEFFAGGGMARAGLGLGWQCLFANDIDGKKVSVYRSNWGEDHLVQGDVAALSATDLPGIADLVWASFPCQDLSLAGDWQGLGTRSQNKRTRSGTFWPFWSLIEALVRLHRAPKVIVLENVVGALTSNGGKDFAAIAAALSSTGYRLGAMVVDAKYFVPQSRPRLFIVAVNEALSIPPELHTAEAIPPFHSPTLVGAFGSLPAHTKRNWLWWRLPAPPQCKDIFADLIEADPAGVKWDTEAETQRLLGMMSDINREKVTAAQKRGSLQVGGVYKRTRLHGGRKVQRAEVRFDDVAGCLRTPRGGSSRQRILLVEGDKIRSRLLSPREAARLMGLPDHFKLPSNYNDAYHVAGDGVVVDVVRHLAAHLLEPLLDNQQPVREAAE